MSPTALIRENRTGKWQLLTGILMLLLGIYMWFNPLETLVALALYAGIIFIVMGVAYFAASFSLSSGWYLAAGILNIMLGVIMIANLGLSVETVPLIFGLWALSMGIVETVAAFQYRKMSLPWKTLLTSGILGLVFGCLILAYPVFSGITIAILLGICFFVYGIMEIMQYIAFKRN